MKTIRLIATLLILIAVARPGIAAETDAAALLARALQAESNQDSAQALTLFLQLERLRPDDPFVLQKIARQYSDTIVDLADRDRQVDYAERALAYAQHATELAPDDPVNVLSIAIARGKLATLSDTRTKVELSRLIKRDAERALALDPDYAWAHHVLGRWHYEVAELGTLARWIVRLGFGGLPEASHAAAITHLERAIALEPEVLAHHLELGFAYLAVGREAEARHQFEYGLELPSREKHDEVAKARARRALTETLNG